jgi:hypothetical protein
VNPTYTGVVGLKQGNLDAFILEEALGLGQVQRSVVRRSVPGPALIPEEKERKKDRRVPVRQEGDLVSRHVERSKRELQRVSSQLTCAHLGTLGGLGG